MSAAWIQEYLQPGRQLIEVGNGVVSALQPGERSSGYDNQALSYDHLVGNRLYNRLVWGTSTASYRSFAATAVADADGPLLDVGCGTAVFTADCYRNTDRPLVLVDRSLGMLTRAAERLSSVETSHVGFVQADVFDLPFRTGVFATVACHGLLHLFENPGQLLCALRAQVTPGGSLYATSLVAETRFGAQWLRLLHRLGESAPPRRQEALMALARETLGAELDLRTEGCMTFLRSSVSR